MDKFLHFAVSAVLVVVFFCFLPVGFAMAASMLVGVAKEIVWDRWMGRGTFSWDDLKADLAGVIYGWMICSFISIM